MRISPLFGLLLLNACGIAYNTTVAEHGPVRLAMIDSIVVGHTTEKEVIARWGRPVQKVYEGSQVDYVYRDMRDPESGRLSEFGDSSKYVIVTFQFGKAIGVTSNDLEFCRSTFAPRPPGAGFFNPGTVHPLPHCPGVEGQNGVEADSFGSSELK